jgi:O-antigen/teichoic acid export membrane protein
MRRLLGQFGLLAGASVLAQLIGFIVLTIVARKLGPSNLGVYAFAASVVAYFAIPANFGLATLGIRDIAGAPDSAGRVIAEVLMVQVTLAVLLYGVLVATAPLLAPDSATESILPIVGLTLILTAVNLEWALQGLTRMASVAVSRVSGQVVYGIIMPLVAVGGLVGAKRYAWVNNIGFAVAGLVAFALLIGHVSFRIPRPNFAALRERFLRSLPIGIALVMIQVYSSLDSVMLGYFKDTAAVGEYAVAYKIPLAVIGLASVWQSVVFPQATRLFKEDRELLGRRVGIGAALAGAVMLPVVVATPFVAEKVIVTFFGEEFAGADTAFAILMAVAGVIFVSINFGGVALACGDERRFAIGVGVGAVINFALNLVLIPADGAAGAAVSTLVAELVVIVYMIRRVRHLLGTVVIPWDRLRGTAAGAAALGLVLLVTPSGWDVWLRLALASLAYVVVAVATGAVRRSDLALVRTSVSG